MIMIWRKYGSRKKGKIRKNTSSAPNERYLK
jgi:hypothetical protein